MRQTVNRRKDAQAHVLTCTRAWGVCVVVLCCCCQHARKLVICWLVGRLVIMSAQKRDCEVVCVCEVCRGVLSVAACLGVAVLRSARLVCACVSVSVSVCLCVCVSVSVSV